MQANQQCQVCFVTSFPIHPYQFLIRCTRCLQVAHRYCYLPSSSSNFICDSCKENYKGNCAICDNPGLLKRNDRGFAHPACLLLSHAHMGNGANLVNSFRDLSFLPPEPGKLPKRTKCHECGKTNSAALTCNLSCSRACHIYCALKSRIAVDSKGWLVSLPFSSACDYSDIFEHIVHRRLYSQNQFLRKKLHLSKQSKRQQVHIYCEEHSSTMIDCRCRTFSEEKNDWIFCEGCSRWLHLKCVDNEAEAQKVIKENSPYLCTQCKHWRKAVVQKTLVLPEELPKLHLYDFVLIHTRIEEAKFEVSPQLLDFATKMPVLPGKEYIQVPYRRQIAKILRNTIDFSDIRKQIESCDGENSMVRFTKICNRAKDKLFLMWWLCQQEIISGNQVKKQIPFLAKRQEETFDSQTSVQVIDVMIRYGTRYFGGKTDQLSLLKSRLSGVKQEYRSMTPEHKDGLTKAEKTLNILMDKVKSLLHRIKNKQSKQNTSLCLGQLHSLLQSTQIIPLLEELSHIPIIMAFTIFKKKQTALKYMKALADIQVLKKAWKRMIAQQSPVSVKEKLIQAANNFLKLYVYEGKEDALKTAVLKQWGKLELMTVIPSQTLILAEPEPFLPSITFQNLTMKKVKDSIEKFQNNPRTIVKGESQLEEYLVMERFLQTVSHLPFTRISMNGMLQLSKGDWKGELKCLIPLVAQQFIRFYELTEQLLSQHSNPIDEDVCVFVSWARDDSIDSLSVPRYVAYFQDIEQIRLDFFSYDVYDILKAKLAKLIQCMEKHTPVFDSSAQFRLLTRWCNKLKVIPDIAGAMMEKDRAFQHGFSLLRLNFDNIQALGQVQTFLSSYLGCFRDYGMDFRVQHIRTMLSWIDLHRHVLAKVPPRLLLSEKQIEALESPSSSNTRLNYFILKQTLSLMRQLRFPQSQFLQRFVKVVDDGQMINSLVNRVLDHCDWGFELSQEYGEKLTLQQFDRIYDTVKNSSFTFEAEIIEFDIIRDKFEDSERQANLLNIQYQATPQCSYLQEKSKQLLIKFGTYPITSKCPQFLWRIYELPRLKGMPENIEQYISQAAVSYRKYSWKELECLQIEMESRLESKFLKKQSCSQLKEMIVPCKEFSLKCVSILKKYSERATFSESQIELIGKLLDEEAVLRFKDEAMSELRVHYTTYQYVKSHSQWDKPYRKYSTDEIMHILEYFAIIHPSFGLPDINKYRAKLEEELNPSKKQNQVAKIEPDEPKAKLCAREMTKEKDKESDRSGRLSSKMGEMSSLESNASNKQEKHSNLKPIPEKRSSVKATRKSKTKH